MSRAKAFLLAQALLGAANAQCDAATFQSLSLFGGEILNVEATPHSNLTYGPEYFLLQLNQFPMNITGLDICEVAVTYTHPGQNDTINAIAWLPTNWNGRFMGVGGGGWATGQGNLTLARPAADGYAAIITDGGHSMDVESSPIFWGLSSPGNVNWQLLQDFASIALDDAATVGKEVVRAYYGRAQSFSYFNGCSTGGRQGHMMAQRYADQYDGILATAPAFNWNQFLLAELWPQVIMNELGEYPSQCELDAVRLATIEACDGLDGAEDGLIVNPALCDYDPSTAVGRSYSCSLAGFEGENATITEAAAMIANATWKGPVDAAGISLWYGLTPGTTFDVLANASCVEGTCSGTPFSIPAEWVSVFLARDPDFDVTSINRTSFARLFRQSLNIYDSILGTADPDLTDFRDAGGKLITWHGMADQLIFPNGTVDYAQRVKQRDPHSDDYYRFFEAPGVFHCGTGPGWFPGAAFESLVEWVENGTAPETLAARAIPNLYAGLANGATELRDANLCLYPRTITYEDGDPNSASSFGCR